MVQKSKQTIYNYYRYSTELEGRGEKRLIPKGINHLDKQGTIYYTPEDIKALKRFIRYKKNGIMKDYNNRVNKRYKYNPKNKYVDDLI